MNGYNFSSGSKQERLKPQSKMAQGKISQLKKKVNIL